MNKLAQSILDTYQHTRSVAANINIFIIDLINRANDHDKSKLESPELEIFGEHSHKLAGVQFGSEEYKKLLAEVKPAIDHHYSKNRHHFQFHKNGVNDMTLIDILEMLADSRAATERNLNGNIRKSLDILAEQNSITPQLKQILENTITEYFD